MRRKLAAGNWKMNGSRAAMSEIRALTALHPSPTVDVLICPPATHIFWAYEAMDTSPFAVGGQDCHPKENGAHTGDITAEMLKDVGASAVILGHSERRGDHGESDALVRAKVEAAHRAGLTAILCLGESLAQREAGETLAVVGRQLVASLPETVRGGNTVVAYEPIWAIGTGLTPTLEQIAEVHAFLRRDLMTRFGVEGAAVRLLYGGSVKPSNAAGIFALPEVDGALVGGASLKAAEFSGIISALENA